MKKGLVWIFALICIAVLLGACERQEPDTTKVISLGKDDLTYFNSSSFFNGEYLNIRNQFLSSLYDKPENINLFELFYCGSGIDEKITEEELKAVMKKSGMTGSVEDIPCPCEKISKSNMNKILKDHMNIRLDDTNKIGLERFVYLQEYDAYYYFHGDTNYRVSVDFSKGERKGDLVKLFYNDGYFNDGYKVLTLRELNGSYIFVSNQKTEEEIN